MTKINSLLMDSSCLVTFIIIKITFNKINIIFALKISLWLSNSNVLLSGFNNYNINYSRLPLNYLRTDGNYQIWPDKLMWLKHAVFVSHLFFTYTLRLRLSKNECVLNHIIHSQHSIYQSSN